MCVDSTMPTWLFLWLYGVHNYLPAVWAGRVPAWCGPDQLSNLYRWQNHYRRSHNWLYRMHRRVIHMTGRKLPSDIWYHYEWRTTQTTKICLLLWMRREFLLLYIFPSLIYLIYLNFTHLLCSVFVLHIKVWNRLNDNWLSYACIAFYLLCFYKHFTSSSCIRCLLYDVVYLQVNHNWSNDT